MKLIIAGSRDLKGQRILDIIDNSIHLFSRYPTEIVSGTARGVDKTGEFWAHENDLPVTKFPADWDSHQKLAGFIRNQQMADYADALLVIYLPHSKGSMDMLRRAKKAGLEVVAVMLQM